MFGNGMTNEQFNSHLETLAKLIEAKAQSVDEAAQIVRDAKILSAKDSHTESALSFVADNLALPEIRVEKKPADSDDA